MKIRDKETSIKFFMAMLFSSNVLTNPMFLAVSAISGVSGSGVKFFSETTILPTFSFE